MCKTPAAKLLRVLQEKTYERVGDTALRTANCRIVAATNKNLKTEVANGGFREDLYYRLSVFPIEVPPLRDRRGDIPLLVQHFLELNCRRFGVDVPQLSQRECDGLMSYAWPGNVRELQNIVEQAALRLRIGPLEFHLPPTSDDNRPTVVDSSSRTNLLTYEQLKELERTNLLAALLKSN
jgi:transcriptional regulator with GAF, ATPase, and Fis domain